MDRLKEIKDKYEMNGVESLTSEEIEYVESEFKRSLEDDLDFKLKQIIIAYYTKKIILIRLQIFVIMYIKKEKDLSFISCLMNF